MKKYSLYFLIPLVLITFLSGCGVYKARQNTSALMQLSVGDSKEKLISLMGEPKSREVYGNKEYWIYKTNISSDTLEMHTPILIMDGKVSGWGKNYWKDIRQQSATPASSSNYSQGGGVVVLPSPYTPSRIPDPPRIEVQRQKPFLDAPQQGPIQNPSVNCVPNGFGGFRCN